jgi:ABC-2 type transport system permease protein
MIADTLTVFWKEMKEIVIQGPKFRGGWVGTLIFLGVFGVMMPLQSGLSWLTSPLTLLVWAWVPFLLVNSVTADSFAGERERHTLETLLASRLTDISILFGKLAASLAYGWGLTLVCLLLSVVTINLVHWQGYPVFFPISIAGGTLILSFLVAMLAAGLGILVSLRAATVRQAQQTLSAMMFIVFIPLIALPMLPEGLKTRFGMALVTANLEEVVLAAAAALALIDAVLLAAAMTRFRRSRMILD